MSRIPERASQPFALGPAHAAQPDRRRTPWAGDARRRAGSPRGRGLLAPRRGGRRGDDYRGRHDHGPGIDVAPADRHRGVASRRDPRLGSARGGDSLGGCGGRPPDRPSRARDHGRGDVVRAGGAVVCALAARADAPGGAVGGGRRRGRGGISHLERQRRAGRLPGRRAARGSRLFARPVPVARRPIFVPAPPRSPSGCRSSAGSRGRSASRLRS